MPSVIVLRSAENPALITDLRQVLPTIDWIYIPMPFLPGRGESHDERANLLQTIKTLITLYSQCDAVFYARAYGAFSSVGRKALSDVCTSPVISAPGAVQNYFQGHHWHNLFVLTPYGQERHQYEVTWVNHQGFVIIASACLGYDDGHDIACLRSEDIAPAVMVGSRSPTDGIYLACTVTRTLTMDDAIRPVQGPSMISATEAMLWALKSIIKLKYNSVDKWINVIYQRIKFHNIFDRKISVWLFSYHLVPRRGMGV